MRGTRSRTTTRRRRRGRRTANRSPIAAIVAGVVGVAIVAGATVAGVQVLADNNTPSSASAAPQVPCLQADGVDRSGSVDAEDITANWADEMTATIDDARSCNGVFLVETISAEDDPVIASFDFDVEGLNRLDRDNKQAQVQADAENAIDEVLATNADGRTDIHGFLHAVDRHIGALGGVGDVNVAIWGDAINSTDGFAMDQAAPTDEAIEQLLSGLDLPDCTNWNVSFYGVGRTIDGPLNSDTLEWAEQFWHAYLTACGGELAAFDTARIGA